MYTQGTCEKFQAIQKLTPKSKHRDRWIDRNSFERFYLINEVTQTSISLMLNQVTQ